MAGKNKDPEGAPSWSHDFLAAYDIKPSRDLKAAEVKENVTGSVVKLKGDVETYFGKLFDRDLSRYPIPIAFRSKDKEESNAVRDLVMALAAGDVAARRKASKDLAYRLAKSSPGQAREGLLVVMMGKQGDVTRVVMWRFTAGDSIQLKPGKTEDEDVELKIEPRTFHRKSHYFKGVLYESDEAETGFWTGHLKDNQIHRGDVDSAEYWLDTFLDSHPEITDAHGTGILSRAVKATLKEVHDVPRRENIIAAAKLAQTQKGAPMTLEKFATDYLNDEDVRKIYRSHAGTDEVRNSPFKIDKNIIDKRLGTKRVTIDEEFDIQGPVAKFEQKVKIGVPDANGVREITIKGRITSQGIHGERR